MTTLEILRAARALIAQPGRWTQGSYATKPWNHFDDIAELLGDEACQFCAVGSCYAVGGTRDAERELDKTARGMRVDVGLGYIGCAEELNDTTDLPTVLAMFDATIARLEGQG